MTPACTVAPASARTGSIAAAPGAAPRRGDRADPLSDSDARDTVAAVSRFKKPDSGMIMIRAPLVARSAVFALLFVHGSLLDGAVAQVAITRGSVDSNGSQGG